MLRFEVPAMEVVGLIQRWRDQVRREEKRGLRLESFLLEKKKKRLVTWRVSHGNGYWLNDGVSAMAVVLVACVQF